MTVNEIDSLFIKDSLDIEAFDKNQKNGIWNYIRDGCEIVVTGRPHSPRWDFHMVVTPPKPKFYELVQHYYPDGKIKVRGKWVRGADAGMWESYDEAGNKTIVNEDEKYGKFSCNDVYLFAHQKGLINIHTGENRERFEIYYNKEENYWLVTLNGTPEYDVEERYYLNGDTGKVLEHTKGRWTYRD